MSESKKQLSVIFVSGNYLVTLRQLRQNYGEVRFNFVLEKIVLYTYVYICIYNFFTSRIVRCKPNQFIVMELHFLTIWLIIWKCYYSLFADKFGK